MRNRLHELQNVFFHDYTINVHAGAEAGIGMAAFDKVPRDDGRLASSANYHTDLW